MLETFARHLVRRLRRLDLALLLLCAVLLGTGLAFIYGAGQQIGGDFADFWRRQLVSLGLGLFCFLVLLCLDYELLGRLWPALYLAGVGLLVAVLVFGQETNGAKSWLVLGPLRLQPAELMKPALAVTLAWLASRPGIRIERWQRVPLLALLTGIPFALICCQPDVGTALVLVPMVLSVLFVGGFRWKWIAVGVLALALAAPLAYALLLKDYQKDRIKVFMSPSEDISDTGWNAHQSLIAVGSGGLWGKGYMQGTQHVLGFLPKAVASTDFIFSVVAEETGFVGAALVVAAFAGVIMCCIRTAVLAPDAFGAYLAATVAAMLSMHVYINVGMTVRAAPIIGVPLPFISYGGSFMLCTMISMGLVQSVYVQRLGPDER